METIFAESKAFYQIGFFERKLRFCLFAFSEANWAYSFFLLSECSWHLLSNFQCTLKYKCPIIKIGIESEQK